MRFRGNGLVREHVIDEGGAVRAWESDIRDLSRCWFQHENFKPIAAYLSVQVDKNFDSIAFDPRRRGFVRKLLDIDELIGRCDDAPAEVAFVVFAM